MADKDHTAATYEYIKESVVPDPNITMTERVQGVYSSAADTVSSVLGFSHQKAGEAGEAVQQTANQAGDTTQSTYDSTKDSLTPDEPKPTMYEQATNTAAQTGQYAKDTAYAASDKVAETTGMKDTTQDTTMDSTPAIAEETPAEETKSTYAATPTTYSSTPASYESATPSSESVDPAPTETTPSAGYSTGPGPTTYSTPHESAAPDDTMGEGDGKVSTKDKVKGAFTKVSDKMTSVKEKVMEKMHK